LKKHRILGHIILLIAIFFTNIVNAEIEVSNDFKSKKIWDEVEIAKDFRNDSYFDYNYIKNLPFRKSGKITLDTVGDFWIKFNIKNVSNIPTSILISTSRFQEIKLYYRDRSYKFRVVNSGLETQFNKREFINGSISKLPFELANNSSQEIYIWIKQTTPNLYQYAPLPLTISNFKEDQEQKNISDALFYFFLGAIVLMTLYNLALYFVLKKKVYVHYVLNNTFILLFVIAQYGALDILFFDSPKYHEDILLVIGNFAFLFYMFFTKSILNFKKYDKIWDDRLNIALIIWPFLLIFVFTNHNIIAVTFGSIGALVGYTIVIISCIKAIKAGSGPAKFFLAGNIFYYAGIIVSIFQINNIFPTKILGLTAIEFVELGTMFQLALFSLTLGAVINIMKGKLTKKEIERQKQETNTQIKYAHLVEQKNLELKAKVIFRTRELAKSSRIIEQKNNDITDSMNYARRIQNAILPDRNRWNNLLKDSFYLYMPKDIISGDFYWATNSEEAQKLFFAVADCTGHGIPGAMVSVVGINSLNQCINEHRLFSPNTILDKLTSLVEQSFENNGNNKEEIKDGMDIGLCAISERKGKTIIEYSGANTPLWIVRDVKNKISPIGYGKKTNHDSGYNLFEFKPDKQPIGKFHNRVQFTNHEIELFKGDQIYLFSDGYVDQFGGEFGKKLKFANFRNIIFEIHPKTPEQQRASLHNHYRRWKGNEEQVDDICIVGVKI
jgi:serine phosphatase RsbU (regulator of sigma subunit)